MCPKVKDESWVQTMNEDMNALEKHETWEIVERPRVTNQLVVGGSIQPNTT